MIRGSWAGLESAIASDFGLLGVGGWGVWRTGQMRGCWSYFGVGINTPQANSPFHEIAIYQKCATELEVGFEFARIVISNS